MKHVQKWIDFSYFLNNQQVPQDPKLSGPKTYDFVIISPSAFNFSWQWQQNDTSNQGLTLFSEIDRSARATYPYLGNHMRNRTSHWLRF
jgi:hypothetical protein